MSFVIICILYVYYIYIHILLVGWETKGLARCQSRWPAHLPLRPWRQCRYGHMRRDIKMCKEFDIDHGICRQFLGKNSWCMIPCMILVFSHDNVI